MQDETRKANDVQDKSKEADSRDVLKESAHRVWLAGLGALASAGEEGSRIFGRLVERGRATDSRIEQTAEALSIESFWQGWADEIDQKVTTALGRFGLPTRDDVKVLERRIEELGTSLESVESQMRPRAVPSEPTIFVAGSASLPGTSGKPPR